MRRTLRLLPVILWQMLMLLPPPALAEATLPPPGSVERIRWAVDMIGGMPPLMIGSLIAIGVLALLIIIACLMGGKDK